MKIYFAAFYSFAFLYLQSATAAITIATVPIGNAGNPADTQVMSDGTTGYGSVAYNYNIGKYDVTVGQYAAFLNAVAATDTYGLYNMDLQTTLFVAGISQSGSSGGYTYSVIGSPNHPITYVSWGDAARFANWMNNGQPTGAEGPGTTETGAYTLNGALEDVDLLAVKRNPGATWVIPTENEWYKAAYYDPVAGHYWTYATGTNTAPTSAPPGNSPNTANYYDPTTGFAVTGSTSRSNSQNYLTDVGAYTASASPYGAFDMAGDVNQWNEAFLQNEYRGVRGYSWANTSGSGLPPLFFLQSSTRLGDYPGSGNLDIGFRMAEAPAPSTEVQGDFNQDGHVTAADIPSMMNALTDMNTYLTTNNLSNADLLAIGDINGDGVVNNADLQSLLILLKSGGGSNNPVPEPKSFVLALIGLASAGILRMRHRNS